MLTIGTGTQVIYWSKAYRSNKSLSCLLERVCFTVAFCPNAYVVTFYYIHPRCLIIGLTVLRALDILTPKKSVWPGLAILC